MDLLDRIETHIRQTRTSASTFGIEAVGDPRFVWDLRAGRRPRRKMQERVGSYLDNANPST